MKNKTKTIAFLLLIVFLFLTACNKKTGSDQNSSAILGSSSVSSQIADNSDISSGSTSGSSSVTSGGQSSSSKTTGSSSSSSSSSGTVQGTKYFKVEDYGAKGDGVTDDGTAVSNAIKAAAKDRSALKIVQFRANATYRLASAPSNNSYNRVINVISGSNVKIQGNNTTLLMKAPYRVAYFTESENIEFSGFNIDYSPKPYTVGIVTAVSTSNSTIEFTSDDDLGFEGTVSPPAPYFAFRNRKDERRHFNISSMVKLGDKKYRFTISSSNVSMASVGEEFILPVYGSSHNIGGIITIDNVKNFDMKNVVINAAPDFGVGMRSNSGYTNFTNVKMVPSAGQKAYLVSWRDGYHIKDNLSKITWDNCYIGPLGDDAFNISSVICNVNSFNLETKTISMTPTEAASTRDGLAAGDELVAYNMQTGAYIGEAKVTEVLPANGNINVRVDKSLSGLSVGCQVAFYRWNKDYVVKNSYIEGTVRIRSTGTFENCQFNVFWVRVENESYVEGPVPKDVLFKNCTFTTPYNTNPEIFHVGTLMKTGVSGTPQYKCKNIVLERCTFTKGTYGADPGNELIVR